MALADLAPGEHAETVRNHWWWRPGWQPGRRFYAFHITFEGDDTLHELVSTYQAALAPLPALTMVPARWLHMTIQGIGFTDEVPRATALDIAAIARALVAQAPPFEVAFHDLVVADEAIALPAEPADPVKSIRRSIRQGIARVLGVNRVGEDPDRFRPHVSVAYITRDGSAAPYVATAKSTNPDPVHVKVTHLDLIEMHRDHRMYEWQTLSTARLQASK
jgi:hypothetical protein